MQKTEQTVVFFFPNILRDAHRYIFQLERLIEENYNVILLDATKYYGKSAIATDELILKHKVECSTDEDFQNFRNELPNQPVIYVAFDQYMRFAAPLFNIIVRPQDKMLSYHTKRFSSVNQSSSTFKKVFEKMLREVDNVLPLNFFKSFYRKKYNLYMPDYYLCSTTFLIPIKVLLTIPKDKRIVVHADDINQLLYNKKPVINKNKKIGVFLDQGIPFLDRTHPKLYSKDIFPVNYLEDYYRNLERTLIFMQEKLNLDEVVIALHPDAKKFERELQDKFLSFKQFSGRSPELIRDARVAFAHCSASINFAIYYKKPVIILKDDFLMTKSETNGFMEFFLKDLDMNGVDMEKTELNDAPNILHVNEPKYKEYTQKYLKDNNIQENSYYYAIRHIKKDLEKE